MTPTVARDSSLPGWRSIGRAELGDCVPLPIGLALGTARVYPQKRHAYFSQSDLPSSSTGGETP